MEGQTKIDWNNNYGLFSTFEHFHSSAVFINKQTTATILGLSDSQRVISNCKQQTAVGTGSRIINCENCRTKWSLYLPPS